MRRYQISFFIAAFVLLGFQTADANWVKQSSNTLGWLRSVFFVSEKTGWIGGSNGTLLLTTDGGDTWKPTKKFTTDTIRQIYFKDKNNGWLLCERDVFSLGANSPSYLLKTVNGGTDWEKIEFANAERTRIAGVFFSENSSGFAVGESGAIFLSENDNAAVWTKQPSPIRYLLLDGAFTGKNSGVIVGAGGNIYFTEDGGKKWNQSTVFGTLKTKLNAVFFIDKNTGWTVGAEGRIFQTLSGGKNWREQKTGVTDNLNDILFTDAANGWVVGEAGTILYSNNSGSVWYREDTKIRHQLESLADNGKTVFAVGYGGTVLRRELSGQKTATPGVEPKLLKKVH